MLAKLPPKFATAMFSAHVLITHVKQADWRSIASPSSTPRQRDMQMQYHRQVGGQLSGIAVSLSGSFSLVVAWLGLLTLLH